MLRIFRQAVIAVAASALLGAVALGAEDWRVFPAGQLPADARLGPLKDLNGYFPFAPPATPEAWARRADEVRLQMRVALGLWPEPTRTPLHAVIHDRIEGEEYTVEKVFFEAMPGFLVSGSLYRPRGRSGPFPAVLCPHGHWPDGRFQWRTDAHMEKDLSNGGERFPESGRSVFQSFAVQLARMGCVAFVVDLVGYGDSQQIGVEVAHKIAVPRPEMETRERWGLFSPQAESHAQNVLGLQVWSLIRSLDFLTSLPDVDSDRLACSGASSGATQTLLLGALDARLAVAFPTVMVSTAMQGGCACENAPLLRLGTGNIEIAALFAPKPMGIVSANDWTKETATKGFPELQQLWATLGAPESVQHWSLLQYGHNFNEPSRDKVYGWLNQHLALGLPDERLHEREYPLLARAQLTVWDASHPAPKGGADFERGLLQWWHDDAQKNLRPDFAALARPAWRTLLGADGQRETTVEHRRTVSVPGEGRQFAAELSSRRARDGSFDLPQLMIKPAQPAKFTVLWLDERGKAGLFATPETLRPEVVRLLEAGIRVLGVDLFEQGEFRGDGQPVTQTRRVENPRAVAAFTFGYNRALFAQRVQDICATLSDLPAAQSAVVALDGTGPLAAAALALLPARLAAINAGGFRFAGVTNLREPNFLPGGAKYGDLPGLLALAEPRRLYLLGEEAATFANRPEAGNWVFAGGVDARTRAIDWLLEVAGK